MSYNIFINELSRVTIDGEIETLTFQRGVNLILGNSNSGKTVWLKMLDYLLGDRGTIEEALGQETGLVAKYRAVIANVTIGDNSYILERDWHTPGNRGKIKVGEGVYILANDFSEWMFDKLTIPQINIPKGNPYINNWIELSFRTMLRHIYRQERFWQDLADKQPDFEQYAVMCQFLGIADRIFSASYDSSISKSKELLKLESRREQLEEILDSITRSMTANEDADRINFVTKSELERAINDLLNESEALLQRRKEVLAELMDKVNQNKDKQDVLELEILDRRKLLLSELEILEGNRGEMRERIASFRSIESKVASEVEKLSRSQVSGLISDLKITHCPACDQEVETTLTNDGECFLCHRHTVANNADYAERIEFEINQLSSERKELSEILVRYNQDLLKLDSQKALLNEQLALIERQLRPLRQELAPLMDERVGFIDTERGRVTEKVENYKRLLQNFEVRTNLISEIDRLTGEINVFETEAEALTHNVDYERLGSILEDGMNEYLNGLIRQNISVWPHGRIHVRLTEKTFAIRVGDRSWKSLSALYQEYVLLAYHYSLLKLTNQNGFHYPGLLIIDFPPQFGEETMRLDTLDYIIVPFISLSQADSYQGVQVIFSGKTISDLESTNVIHLGEIWTSPDTQ
ncbi:MAG TPA: hypothetical protein VK508_18550 [Cyclobacteriaceae bacterium]|nr:hypothetical protein [Cyclobacteriaceae bacterium]